MASPVQTAALIRQQQQTRCCSLIYNCPFLGCQAHPPADPASIPPSKPVRPQIVGASSASFAPAWRRKLSHSAAPPLRAPNASLVCRASPDGSYGTPLCASVVCLWRTIRRSLRERYFPRRTEGELPQRERPPWGVSPEKMVSYSAASGGENGKQVLLSEL